MTQVFSYGLRNWYPHMKPKDREIWEAFVSQFPEVYDRVQYDVNIGPGALFDPTVSDERGTDMNSLYQRKIDVIGYKEEQIDIVEVKFDADVSAVAQVLNYKKLYIEDFAPPVEPKAIIITNRIRPDALDFARKMGVTVIVV